LPEVLEGRLWAEYINLYSFSPCILSLQPFKLVLFITFTLHVCTLTTRPNFNNIYIYPAMHSEWKLFMIYIPYLICIRINKWAGEMIDIVYESKRRWRCTHCHRANTLDYPTTKIYSTFLSTFFLQWIFYIIMFSILTIS
jgi:hypothetical protein